MPFSEEEYQQLQELFNLPPTELRTGSTLRAKGETLENLDLEYDTNKVGTVQDNLVALQELDCQILDFESDDSNNAVKVQIEGEYMVDYGSGSTSKRGDHLRKQRTKLLNAIARDLELSINNYSGQARRV